VKAKEIGGQIEGDFTQNSIIYQYMSISSIYITGINTNECGAGIFIGLAYNQGKDIVFRFIIEYSIA
jgi:hypothetical protein